MYIQCFIKKSDNSDVFVDFEGVRYIFTRNAKGDAVCFIGNQQHARRLLMMGPATYIEYSQEQISKVLDGEPAGTPVVLGGAPQRRAPDAKEPLSVDDALAQGGQVEVVPAERPQLKNPTAAEGVAKAEAEAKAKAKSDAETAADWTPEAIENKVHEFKFLNKPKFKQFVDDNAGNLMDWPIAVRTEIAKKLALKFPEHDPGIEGFIINDYLGNDAGDS